MPLDTFQQATHSIGLTLKDSGNVTIAPDDGTIRNILVYIISKLSGKVVAQFSRDVLDGYEQAEIDGDVMMMYLNSVNTQDSAIGPYDFEVHLQVYDTNFANGYQTFIQKCVLMNLNPAHHA